MVTQGKMTKDILKQIDRAGLKHASAGYKYMVSCVKEILESENRYFLVKDIYRSVGAKHGVQWTTVERAIRLAIGRAPEFTKHKTNKELMAEIVDELFDGSIPDPADW